MPETGSTSIQTWLRLHGTYLHDAHHVSILHLPAGSGGPPVSETFTPAMNETALTFLASYYESRKRSAGVEERTALVDDFVEALDRAASELGTVLLTQEGTRTPVGSARPA